MPTSTAALLDDRTNHFLQAAVSFYFSNLAVVEFFSIVISALLFAGVIAVVMKTGWWTLRVDRFRHIILKTDLSKDTAKKSWTKIETHFFKGDENDLKVAIIEADKLLEEALRHAGIRGISLGERLKNLKPAQMPNLDDVWQAHRLRNQIVHEPTYRLKRDTAERAIGIYKKTLQQFELLN